MAQNKSRALLNPRPNEQGDYWPPKENHVYPANAAVTKALGMASSARFASLVRRHVLRCQFFERLLIL